MKVLMIVESPAKAKKIRGYFPEFDIQATIGHFKDLPVDRMGVEPPDHKPEYVVADGKQKVLASLIASAKKADIIYVATDPDREGEAIAAHVANSLGKSVESKLHRVTYCEINKAAITKAIAEKRSINWPLVRAQEACRVVDRYVGYQVSPLLTKKLKACGMNTGHLSAGRVQSIAAMLIVDRDQELKNFKPVDHFGIKLFLNKLGLDFFATWNFQKHLDTNTHEKLMMNQSLVNQVFNRTNAVTVNSILSDSVKVRPPKPLTTSTYVKLMASVLKLTTKQSMDAAQKLFEQGLITYHRTDSPVMSDEFVSIIRSFALRNKLDLPNEPRVYQAGANSQEAHECLRVTDIDLMSARAAGVDDPQLQAIYKLVWINTLVSQLSDGIDQQTKVIFKNDSDDEFVSHARIQKTSGWRSAETQIFGAGAESVNEAHDDESQDDGEPIQKRLPKLEQGEPLTPTKKDIINKQTTPPPVYTEKTLVAQLEKLGIGRPSTYASIIERIVSVGYVERSKNLRFSPTSKGISVVNALKNNFSFMATNYTATIETSFDLIAARKADYKQVVHAVWEALQNEIKNFEALPLPNSIVEPQSEMVANKPKATVTPIQSKEKSQSISKTPESASKKMPGDQCPLCQKGKLAVSQFKSGNNAGKPFIGCSGFPACRYFSWLQ